MRAGKLTIYAFLALFLLSIALAINLFWPYFTAIFSALVLLSIFLPLERWLEKTWGMNSRWAATISTFLAFICVLLPVIFFSATLTEQALLLYQEASNSGVVSKLFGGLEADHTLVQFTHNLATRFSIEIPIDRIQAWLTELSQSLSLLIYESLKSLASNILNIAISFLIVLVILFTLLTSGDRLLAYLAKLSPIPEKEINVLIEKFGEISWAVFVGNGIVSLFQGVLGGFAFQYIGLGPGVFWGTVIAILAFLPVVGASVVFIPASIVAYFEIGPAWAGAYLAFNFAYAMLLEMLLKPKLIGDKISLHPVLVFIAVFSGVELYGIAGFFYGPLILTLFLTLADLYQTGYAKSLTQLK